MKPKQIIFVLVAFIVLGVLYWMQQQQRYEVVEGLGFEPVLGERLATADIQGFKCYLAGREDEALHLVLQDGKWLVRSKHDAPASETKVNELVEKLRDLEGELRSSSSEVLDAYGLSEAETYHLILYNSAGQELKHLLLGKQGANWDQGFVRLANSNDVYIANDNLRSRFGIYGEGATQVPDARQWCDLVLMAIPREDIVRVEVDSAYRRLVLEEREIAPPEIDQPTDAEPIPTPLPEKEWVMVEPAWDSAPKESGINRLLGAFASVNVSEVVDRGGLDKYGLDDPRATITVATHGGAVRRLKVGSAVPAGAGAHYVLVDDGDLVYKMDRWKLETLFAKMTDFVDIEFPTFAKDQIARIEIESGDRKYEFSRSEGAWQVLQPATSRALKADRVDRIATALSSFRPQDMVTQDAPETTGLNNPSATVRFEMTSGERHQVLLGNEVPVTDGNRFFRLNDRPEVLTMTQANRNDMIPPLSDLFDMKLFQFFADDVAAMTLKDATGEIRLELAVAELPEDATDEPEGPKWIYAGDIEREADGDAVGFLLISLEGLRANDLVPPQQASGLEPPRWSAQLTLNDQSRVELAIGDAAPRGGYYARVHGEETAFIISAFDVRQYEDLTRQLRE